MASYVRIRSMLAVLLCSLVALPGVQSSAGRHEPQAYHIKIDETQRDDIRQRASNFLVTPNIDVPEWYDGPPGPGLGSIAKYWATEFDFQRFEDEINNNFSHYMTTLPPPGGGYNRSLEVHYVHQVSERTDAIPILFLHGWPSTSLEWAEIIPSLVAPPNATLPAFHAVAPDLPGYGFSPAPTAGGLGAQEQAVTFANLMQQLGYERYALYSTDLGAPIAQKFVETFPERIINHVTDFFFITPNATDVARYTANTTTPEETAYIESLDAFGNNHAAYSAVSSTLPLSVAYAFLDSPVGFLAWVWQLVHTVDDRVQTAESLIRRTLLLYLPGPYNNIRSYKELFPSAFHTTENKTQVPTSIIQFGFDPKRTGYPVLRNINFVPREWIERFANVTYFNRHPHGAHFPAEAQPDWVLEDIWRIFAQ